MPSHSAEIMRLARDIEETRDKLLRRGVELREVYNAGGGDRMTDHDLQAMAIGAMVDAGVCPSCHNPATLVVQCVCGGGFA